MTADPIAEARAFKNTFEPQEGVDYAWVVTRAKEDHANMLTVFRRLDDKAGAVINYLGGGSGLLALGTFAGLTSIKVNPWVIPAVLVPIALTVAALVCAAIARRTANVSHPPGARDAIHYAEFFTKGQAEAAFVGLWVLATEEMAPVVSRKAELVDRAIWLLVAAVASLSIPIVAVALLPRPA